MPKPSPGEMPNRLWFQVGETTLHRASGTAVVNRVPTGKHVRGHL